jgi:hypothetical protein
MEWSIISTGEHIGIVHSGIAVAGAGAALHGKATYT